MKRGANYEIAQVTAISLVIRDVGPWTLHPTVTNDAENVVKRLIDDGHLKPNVRLFYYDSDCRLDELLHDGERFTGFAPGPRS